MGGEAGRGRSRWVPPALAGIGALVVATQAVLTSLATSAVPPSWTWARDANVLWPTIGGLIVVAAGLTAWAARSSRNDAVSGTTTIVAGSVSVTVPEPPNPPGTGPIVVGELPGAPPGFVEPVALAAVAAAFDAAGDTAAVCTLTGPPGVGKTQVAAAFARHRVEQRDPLVAWTSGESHDQLLAGLAEVARALGVADPEGDSARSAARLRDHLATWDQSGLLVVDNATDPDRLRPLLPTVGHTHVAITSIDQSFVDFGTPVQVREFDRRRSMAYLRSRTGLDDDRGADGIADELGDLPIALAQAASVIRLQRLGYADYLERLRASAAEVMLPRHAGQPYPTGTADAIRLAVRTVEDTDPSGATGRLLRVVAVLCPDVVNRSLLRSIEGTDDPARTDAKLGELVGMSLLVWGETADVVVVHRLIARIVRERSSAMDLSSAIMRTVTALRRLWPAEEDAWTERDRARALVPHTLATWGHAVRAFEAGGLGADQLRTCAMSLFRPGGGCRRGCGSGRVSCAGRRRCASRGDCTLHQVSTPREACNRLVKAPRTVQHARPAAGTSSSAPISQKPR